MITTKDLKLTVNGNIVLENFNVEIPSSEITVLIGENGSGKSSFLKLVSGVWNNYSGNISYSEMDFKDNMLKLKEETGFLFEIPFFYESLSGEEFIRLVCNLRKHSFDEERFRKFIDLFQIGKFVEIPVFELPKGVRQKFGIISVLMHDPKYILLDEPMNGLDPVSVRILKEILVNEKKKGKIIILSTHILEVAEKIGDRVIIIDKGNVIFSGTISDLKKEQKNNILEDIFINLTGGEKYRELLSLI